MTGRWAASQGQHSVRLSEIKLSSAFVLGGEDTNRNQYAPPYGDAVGRTTSDCDQDDANSPCVSFPGQLGGFLQHPNGNNILFGDLHVNTFRTYDGKAMTFDARAMRSWDDVLPASGFQ
jgi:prepilin-type processing-associated H-X9-DG protein